MSVRSTIGHLGAALALMLCTTGTVVAAALPALFTPVAAPLAADRVTAHSAAPAAMIEPAFDVIDALATSARAGAAPRFLLHLDATTPVEAEVTATETAYFGAVSLAFRLPGIALSSGTVTIHDGVMVGDVRYPGVHYRIVPTAGGAHELVRVDDPALREAGPVRVRGAAPKAAPAGAQARDVPADSGRLIDVMTVWDGAALAGYGGGNAATMQALAAAAVAQSNQIYANSGIAQRLRLVYAGPVTYTQHCYDATSPGADFYCALTDLTDGVDTLSGVAALRDAHGADLVTMLIQREDNVCGIGWIPDTISSGNDGVGFNILDAGCAVGFMSYAHELGHNMGADHDPYVSPDPGVKPYNHGYVSLPNKWITIMAYEDQCVANGFSCTRIGWMSNPSYTVDYDGPGGKPAVTMGTANASNVAMVLNLTAKAVAGYRPTSPSHPITASFTDVPIGNAQFGAVEFLAQAQVSAGCTGTTFCPNDPITRRQMAVFLERTRKNANVVPPAATGRFTDVPAGSQFAAFVEALANDGITQGCTATEFCPDAPVSRAQMAIFILRASCGPAYAPAAATGTVFADVSTSTSGAGFIEKFYRMGITSGCASSPARYCPADALTRGQMAVFLERSFPFLTPSEACTP